MKKFIPLIAMLGFVLPNLAHADLEINIKVSCVSEQGEKFLADREDIINDADLLKLCTPKPTVDPIVAPPKPEQKITACDNCDGNFKHKHKHHHVDYKNISK